MNVAISAIATDLDTTVAGVQTAMAARIGKPFAVALSVMLVFALIGFVRRRANFRGALAGVPRKRRQDRRAAM